jgi:hypothetical protein
MISPYQKENGKTGILGTSFDGALCTEAMI